MDVINFENSGEILRIADNLETQPVMGWLSASGCITKKDIKVKDVLQNIRKNYIKILENYPTLRIKLITKNNFPYWVYASNEEIQFDNLIKIVDEPLIDDVPVCYDASIAPLWRVSLSQIQEKIKIKVIASHAITDGRSIFDLFNLFASYGLNRELNENLKKAMNQPVLYEFGKKDWFTKEIIDRGIDNSFFKDIHIENIGLNPPVELPSHVINPQWDVKYAPISKFCKKYKCSPQAILMAIQNESIRVYHEGKYDDILIPIYIPVDNRNSKYATELFKKSLFFSHVGIVIVFMEPEEDWLKNIEKCYEQLKIQLNTTRSCDDSYFSSNMRNYETGELKFPENYPNPNTYVFASHLGLVGEGYENIQFKSYSPVLEGMYWPNLYGYHNKEIFSFMWNGPYNCPEKFFSLIKETSLKYYNLILNDI